MAPSPSSMLLTALLALTLCATAVDAWWCVGHMSVSLIARRHLQPEVAERVERIAADLSDSGPFPKSPDFVQTACWADDLKSYGNNAMASWHFVNKIYNPSNYPIKKYPNDGDGTIESLIRQLLSTMKASDRGQEGPLYNLNFALGNLIHFYGDIHMPLHSAALFSEEFPESDLGGNRITVTSNGKATNLHAVWDSICDVNAVDIARPMTDAGYDTMTQYVEYLEKKYTFSEDEIAVDNSTEMALEGLQLAEDVVYPGVYTGMTLTGEYLSRCKDAAEARITLGGYRLAYELNKLFGTAPARGKVEGKSSVVLRRASGVRHLVVEDAVEAPERLSQKDAADIALKIHRRIIRTKLALGHVMQQRAERVKSKLRRIGEKN